MNITHRSIIGITIAAMIGAVALVAVSHPGHARATPEASEATQAAMQDSASTYLVSTSPTVSAVVSLPLTKDWTKTQTKRTISQVKPANPVDITLATSPVGNVPERLTVEQEATIQAGLDASDEANRCNPDDCEHVTTDGQDYDLPSETSTTELPQP